MKTFQNLFPDPTDAALERAVRGGLAESGGLDGPRSSTSDRQNSRFGGVAGADWGRRWRRGRSNAFFLLPLRRASPLQATGENNNTWGVILNAGVFQLVDDNINGRLEFVLNRREDPQRTVLGATDEARMAASWT